MEPKAPYLDQEFIFTKLELQNALGRAGAQCDHIYLFIEFDPGHPVDEKSDFPVGRVTLMREDLATTPIYTAELTSMKCSRRSGTVSPLSRRS
ncbi:hypothetical protein FGO68_gene9746 [Halteria grandinella]|uniref:Uncharacterized protein n=1 Tax=Halteria grandinella TaxID=5974 RepID=A0A8J8NEQ2_HALGN|nr:hypothetical protein FGO68_gene9746 [Halteria grandinella]